MMGFDQLGAVSFRVSAALISITCIFYTLIMRIRKSRRSGLLLALLTMTLIDSMTGIVTLFFHDSFQFFSYNTRFIVCYLCKYIYFGTHFLIGLVFFLYIIEVCAVSFKITQRKKYFLHIPFVILELMVLSNPLTGIVFVGHEDLSFSRGIGIYIAYAINVVFFFNCFYLIVKYWNTINRLKKAAMVYFMTLAGAGIIIQMMFTDIACELLCEAIGLMGIMIMVEKEDDRLDAVTRAYNRVSLVQDIESLVRLERSFRAICVRIDDSSLYRKISGYENFDRILREIAAFLKKMDEKINVYKNGDANFFLIFPDGNKEDVRDAADRIKKRFDEGFAISDGEVNIKARILIAAFPDEFENAMDIILLSDVPMESENDKTIIAGDDLGFIIRNIEVEKAITEGINDRNFKVFYQPLYGKKCGCIKAAQALLELDDKKLGIVNFREFMPIAERSGFAEELEIRMIEAVFEFLGNDVGKGYMNIDFVIIHLMAVKVLNKNLVESVRKFIDMYKVDPGIIAFDLSDEMAQLSGDNLRYVVGELSDMGIKLFLGNYESTIPDIDSDIMSKFDGVILSAWRFLDIEASGQGEIILKNRTNMLTQLGKKVVITGVDRQRHAEKLHEISGDYLSGKYYSGPISKNELQMKFWDYDRVVVDGE